MKKKEKVEIAFIIFGGLLSVFSAIGLVMAFDVWQITDWGTALLECIFRGDPKGYVDALVATNGMGCNYTIIINIVNAVWFLPVFLFGKINGQQFGTETYAVSEKLLILCVVFISIYVFLDILSLLGIENGVKRQTLILFLSSAFLQFGCIGFGQIDIFSVLFFLLFARNAIKGNFIPMMLFASFAFCFKGIIIVVLLPILLLLLSDDMMKLVKGGALLCVGPVISKLLSLPFPGYDRMVKQVNATYGFAERFGLRNLQGASVLLILFCIICFVCYYKGQSKQVIWYDYILLPMSVFTGFLFFFIWHPQWLIIPLVFLLAMGLMVERKELFLLINFTINAAYLAYSVMEWKNVDLPLTGTDNNMVGLSFIGRRISAARGYGINAKSFGVILEGLSENANKGARTVLVGGFLLLLVLTWLDVRDKKNKSDIIDIAQKNSFADTSSFTGVIAMAAMFVPILVFEVGAYYFFVMEIVP